MLCLDRLQNRIKYLIVDQLSQTLQTLGQRHSVACLSLFYRYFHGECSTELHDLVPPQWKFHRNTRLAISCANHPHFPRLPLAKTKFHSKSFFLRTAEMWNTLPAECFPPFYNLDLFKSNVNKLQQLDWRLFITRRCQLRETKTIFYVFCSSTVLDLFSFPELPDITGFIFVIFYTPCPCTPLH